LQEGFFAWGRDMVYSVRCRCGRALQVEQQYLSSALRCPSCHELLRLPTLEHPASLRKHLLAGLAALLVILGGVTLALFLGRRTDRDPPPVKRPADPPPVAVVPPTPQTKPKAREMEQPPLRKETPPPAETPVLLAPLPLKPDVPAAPLVARTEPPQPQPGKSFTIQLAGAGREGGPWVYQFRSEASAPWQTAKDGRIALPDLKPEPLTLHFRLLDGRGQPSAVVTRTWTPKAIPEVVKRTPGLKKGDRFYQEVVFGRSSTFRVLGTDIGNQSQYAFLSSFKVEEATEEGPRVVTQKVEAVRLTRADPAQQVRLNALLQKTKGATFRITLGPAGEVVKFEGEQAPLALAQGGALTGELAFLLQSTLDLDGWKELAQLTFFRPPKERSKDGRWRRKMAHHWGPLGAWLGEVVYAPAGKVAALDRYDYPLGLTYLPPRGGGAGLPFQVARSEFRLLPSGGSIAFDAARGRVAAAEERFRVRGVLAVMALGVTSVVEMEESQQFQLRILDAKPPEK
jgi:hypothetical protein